MVGIKHQHLFFCLHYMVKKTRWDCFDDSRSRSWKNNMHEYMIAYLNWSQWVIMMQPNQLHTFMSVYCMYIHVYTHTETYSGTCTHMYMHTYYILNINALQWLLACIICEMQEPDWISKYAHLIFMDQTTMSDMCPSNPFVCSNRFCSTSTCQHWLFGRLET